MKKRVMFLIAIITIGAYFVIYVFDHLLHPLPASDLYNIMGSTNKLFYINP